jgi:hypothetical protein
MDFSFGILLQCRVALGVVCVLLSRAETALLLQVTVVRDRRRYNDAVDALNVELSMGYSMRLRRRLH